MQLPFPNISDYDVSPISGFLPTSPPLTYLPPPYSAWDDLARSLPQSIATKSLRAEINTLPVLPATHLASKPEIHRAFVVLGFLIHAYVWVDGSEHPEPNVPAQLGEPYLEVCERLGMQPTLSYAGLCLWNWRFKDSIPQMSGEAEVNGVSEAEEAMRIEMTMKRLSKLENLDCLVSFTGTRDEAVFYVVPIMVEAEGGRLMSLLLGAMKKAIDGDAEFVICALEETRETLPKMGALIKLLHEHCDPNVFFDKVRPFFPGGKGLEDKGMPNGVVFHRSDRSKKAAKYVGGSAAQSSDFQFMDAALGIMHKPVGDAKGETVFEVGAMLLSYPKLEVNADLGNENVHASRTPRISRCCRETTFHS
jgi:indoleamine 2,3-dioxygenase